MIICHCEVVTDRDVEAAVASGARTVAAACRATGAARNCGTCIFSVKAVVCQHLDDEAPALEVSSAAS